MSLPTPTPSSTAVVTGASSGIGVEIARQLAQRGHGLTLVARRAEALQGVAEELTDAHGVRVDVVPADLTESTSRAAVVDAVSDLGLTIDVLVNNAGLSTTGPVSRSDVAAELGMVRLDVEAVVELCSRVVPGMAERGRGAVLNVASTAAFQPLPGQAGYSGSKAFVLAYTQAMAAELKGSGVTATALCPGPVKTGFGQAAGFAEGEADAALPAFMWEPADAVAKAAVDGLAKGRTVVIPGAANAVGAYAARITPKSLLLPLIARQHPALRKD